MRKTLLLALFAMVPLLLSAQSGDKGWELEPSIGANYPLCSINYSNVEPNRNVPFMRFGLEYRHELANDKLWLGMATTLQSAVRRFTGEREPFQSEEMSFRTLSIMPTFEYRPINKDKFSLFVGTGLGVAQRVGYISPSELDRSVIGVAVAPRIGIQCWGHLRFYLEANITSDIFNTASFNIGWAF